MLFRERIEIAKKALSVQRGFTYEEMLQNQRKISERSKSKYRNKTRQKIAGTK